MGDKETKKKHETWRVMMVQVAYGVEEALDVMSPHVVVFGQTGVGKSSFLNTFLGGIKDLATGKPVFRTAEELTNKTKSCTVRPQSELKQLDVVVEENKEAKEVR